MKLHRIPFVLCTVCVSVLLLSLDVIGMNEMENNVNNKEYYEVLTILQLGDH